MTELIALVSSGKGSWGHVGRLITDHKWDKILLITNDFGKENFKPTKDVEYIIVDPIRTGLNEMCDQIKKGLDGKIKGTEVALNLISGSGKEHMAVLSSILKLGVGFRLIALTQDGMKEV